MPNGMLFLSGLRIRRNLLPVTLKPRRRRYNPLDAKRKLFFLRNSGSLKFLKTTCCAWVLYFTCLGSNFAMEVRDRFSWTNIIVAFLLVIFIQNNNVFMLERSVERGCFSDCSASKGTLPIFFCSGFGRLPALSGTVQFPQLLFL